MTNKVCKICKKFKLHEAKGLCKSCYEGERRKKDPEKFKKRVREWQKNNPKTVKKCKKEWEMNNQKRIKKVSEEWQKNNREKVKEFSKRMREKYPLKYKARGKINKLFNRLKLSKEGECLKCKKYCERLELHHISYEPNITVFGFCSKCHKKIHNEEKDIWGRK